MDNMYVYLGGGKRLPIEVSRAGIRTIRLRHPKTGRMEEWLCVADMGKKLRYKGYRQAVLRHVNSAETVSPLADTTSGQHPLKFITKKGFLALQKYLADRIQAEVTASRVSTVDTYEGIRSIRDPNNGQLWLNAPDVCKKLGYSNTTIVIRRHVNDADVCRMSCNTESTGPRLTLFVSENGYKALENARLKRNNYKQATKVEEEEVAEATPETSNHKRAKEKTPESQLWVPPFAGRIEPKRKCRDDRVVINFSYGSNWLLKGNQGYIHAMEFENQGKPISSEGIFNRFGYFIYYPMEWEEAFRSNQEINRVPSCHQFVLDMLMSDYIGHVRKFGAKQEDNRYHLSDDDWIHNDTFEFRLVEWFTAFFSDCPVSKDLQRIRFYRWAKKVINGLCYLMRAGIIQPVRTSRTPETDEYLQTILRDTALYDGIENAPTLEAVYTGESSDAYVYRFRFAPCWIQEIKSEVLPMPICIPPIVGRPPHSGTGYSHKYTSNRLLYTELHSAKQPLKISPEGNFKLSLRQYCRLTGVPPLSSWAALANLTCASQIRSRYEASLIRGTINAFGLFSVAGVIWTKARESRYLQIQSDAAVITITPLPEN